MVGINHTLGQTINEYTTDHFVIIVGRYCEDETIYYRFWDVGTQYGHSNDYKFILDANNHLSCTSNYNGKKIDVTQIRRNRKLPENTLIDINTLKE